MENEAQEFSWVVETGAHDPRERFRVMIGGEFGGIYAIRENAENEAQRWSAAAEKWAEAKVKKAVEDRTRTVDFYKAELAAADAQAEAKVKEAQDAVWEEACKAICNVCLCDWNTYRYGLRAHVIGRAGENPITMPCKASAIRARKAQP